MVKTKAEKRKIMAVIPLAGQQFLVQEKEEFLVNNISVASLKIKPYLVIDKGKIFVGKPEVKNYICEIKIAKSGIKGEKKVAFKYCSKTGYHRKKGFRPLYSQIQIRKIKSTK